MVFSEHKGINVWRICGLVASKSRLFFPCDKLGIIYKFDSNKVEIVTNYVQS